MAEPSVAVVVPNLNGERHLPACLDSLAALDYERGSREVIVVDNGSTDGSLQLLDERYPWVRVVGIPENRGFAEAANTGARAAQSDYVAFVNNDMRVDPAWLRELVASADAEYRCIAGTILDWDGTHADFVDGYVTFHGAAEQAGFAKPLDEVVVEDGRELPFACGGAMLIDRALFLELGGFDASFFAYLEDVDLGWRVWLAGHRVRLAARARSFHRHHGTAGAFAPYQRQVLWERNALLMLIKNAEDAYLSPLLAGALLLLARRAAIDSGSDRALYEPGAPTGKTEAVSRRALAPLHAVSDVVGLLDEMFGKRREVQRLRRRPDAEIFPLFRRPFAPVRTDAPYLEALATVVEAFRLAELFPARSAAKLLVVPESMVPSRAELDEADVVVVGPGSSELAARARGVVVVDLEEAEALPVFGHAFLVRSEEARRRWQPRVDKRPLYVVPDGSGEALRAVAEDAWRLSAAVGREDVSQLLAHWRREHGADRPLSWHLARAAWRALPLGLRRRLRS